MKKLLLATLPLLALTGCMMPNFSRIVPENKDAHIQILSPLYGTITIDTRVADGNNPLPPLEPPKK
jgi:hypothetical protein